MRAASIGIISDITHDFPVLHPINNYLMRIHRSAKAPDNIRMLQSHPECGFLVECLTNVNFVNEPGWKTKPLPSRYPPALPFHP